MIKTIYFIILLTFFSTAAWSAELETCPGGQATTSQRYLAVISDHHIGNGRDTNGKWYPTEDFRWDSALRTFLDRITYCSNGRADLVIAGDLLELWQPLKHCENEKGCTVDEMLKITTDVFKGHPDTWKILKKFADEADNRIHVIPGNHDAALLIPEIWRVFHDEVGASPGRVLLVKENGGVWISKDGLVLVEHGHQIGSDVNKYDSWPNILHKFNGKQLLVQTWGENFIQNLFNKKEKEYSILDNLSPETAGIRYLMADLGMWGTIEDMANFLAFNLFETTFQQKGSLLGEPVPDDEAKKWDLEIGRKMGHLLFANALAADDPFRETLLGESKAAEALRINLDERARDPNKTSDAEINLLCSKIAIREVTEQRCEPRTLGAMYQKLVVPHKQVMLNHLNSRIRQPGLGNVKVFIYGHTHLLEDAWPLRLNAFKKITVLNSGAFQRVINEEGFLARVNSKPGLTPAEALKIFKPEDLAPCYTAVLVPYQQTRPIPQTVQWYADEGTEGQFVTTDDSRCL